MAFVKKQNVVILGSTGLLGRATLKLLVEHKDVFRVVAICGGSNKSLLEEQRKELELNKKQAILLNEKEAQVKLDKVISSPSVDLVVNVLGGVAGIKPTMLTLEANKKLILGNKESLVANGHLIKKDRLKRIIPLDSEHNAIYEILRFTKKTIKEIKKIYLPCSGGAFYKIGKLPMREAKMQLLKIKPTNALKHPTWKMGNKITLESSTLLNKGFEILEAHYLFNLPLNKIKVFLHPQCQIHGIVEFKNGEIFSYNSKPSMIEHIKNTLTVAINDNFILTENGKNLTKKQIERIKKISAKELERLELIDSKSKIYNNLQGIKIVKSVFIKDRSSLAKFLELEERILEKFQKNEIGFLDIFKILKQC